MADRPITIAGFRLVTADPDRLARFYAAIGFSIEAETAIAPDELRTLGIDGGGRRVAMTLGPSYVDLDRYGAGGRAYPKGARATDLCFQHLALVTDHAAAAWDRARAAGATPISDDGAVALPAASGGVTAVKFRDPDGHPLEFLQFPPGASRWVGRGVLGIDHSALVVADVARARAFYAKHGLRVGTTTRNRGPEQDALDGVPEVDVDVVAMDPADAPPHIELLGYRAPRPGGAAPGVTDIAATRVVWAAARDALLRDPDGHLHQLVAR